MKSLQLVAMGALVVVFAGCVSEVGDSDESTAQDQAALKACTINCPDPTGGGGDPPPPVDPPPVSPACAYEGSPIQGSDATIYLSWGCQRHAFPDMNTFTVMGYSTAYIVHLSDAALNVVPLSTPLPVKLYRDNTLLKSPSNQLFVTVQDQLHFAPDYTTAGVAGANVDAAMATSATTIAGLTRSSDFPTVFPLTRTQQTDSVRGDGDYHYFMTSDIQLSNNGFIYGTSTSHSTYWFNGFTGCAVVIVADKDDNILWKSNLMQLGVDGLYTPGGLNGQHTEWWNEQVDATALAHARKVGVYHYYCPQNRFFTDIKVGLKLAQDIAPAVIAIAKLF